jgi:hypothetical protein
LFHQSDLLTTRPSFYIDLCMLCCDTWFPYEFLILSNENLFLISSYEFSYNENSLRDAMFSRSLRTHMRTHYEKHETIFVRVHLGTSASQTTKTSHDSISIPYSYSIQFRSLHLLLTNPLIKNAWSPFSFFLLFHFIYVDLTDSDLSMGKGVGISVWHGHGKLFKFFLSKSRQSL